MKRFLKFGLPCLLLTATILGAVPPTHDDVFDSENLLDADASQLKATRVSPHLESPIEAGTNVLWCGTFQLAWNEVCSLIGEDVHFAKDEPEMVALLDKKAFGKADLDEGSYVALADFVRNGVHARIGRELQRKFGGRATPKHLPPSSDTPRPQDIVAYSYLFKNLEFETVFERIDNPIDFGGARVSCFGIGEQYKPGQAAMYPQVAILDYQNPDDFVIELRTKSAADRVLLAKVRPKETLHATVLAAEEHMARAKPLPAAIGDVLKVPKFNFDITRKYQELVGPKISAKNAAVAKDLQIVSAVQNTRFQMDEKGVRLRSESHISIGCSAPAPPPRKHTMIFDKPFLVMLQRADAKTPYFALWVDNAEVLVHAGGQ